MLYVQYISTLNTQTYFLLIVLLAYISSRTVYTVHEISEVPKYHLSMKCLNFICKLTEPPHIGATDR